MSMLGFVYLVLILGWILIVLFLKCKKSITPHIGLSDNYTDAIGSGMCVFNDRNIYVCTYFICHLINWTFKDHRRPSVHVIQLQREDLENEDQLIDAYHQQSSCLRRQSQRQPLSAIGEHNLATVYTSEAIVNPAYTHDDEYVINGMYNQIRCFKFS